MLLLLLGTVDLGRMFFDYIELRNAVREGAAYAARDWSASGRTAAVARVYAHGIDPAATVPAPACSGVCDKVGAQGTVTMRASLQFTPVTTAFLQTYFGLEPFTMTASASARAMT
jgi:Flp pilus assembly protein TadG